MYVCMYVCMQSKIQKAHISRTCSSGAQLAVATNIWFQVSEKKTNKQNKKKEKEIPIGLAGHAFVRSSSDWQTNFPQVLLLICMIKKPLKSCHDILKYLETCSCMHFCFTSSVHRDKDQKSYSANNY